MPKKERFVIEQVGRFYRATCTDCLESSQLCKTRYKASKWPPLHTREELDEDFDPVAFAQDLVGWGHDFDG
jgi:hypothetical protein